MILVLFANMKNFINVSEEDMFLDLHETKVTSWAFTVKTFIAVLSALVLSSHFHMLGHFLLHQLLIRFKIYAY